MCSPEETKQISTDIASSFYERFLDDFQKITASIIKANEHVMAHETRRKFAETEERFKKNDEDHNNIDKKVDSIVQSQKEHSEKLDKFLPLLEEIRKNTEARGVLRAFIITWGGIIGGLGLAAWSIFITWHNGQKP